MMAVAEKQQRLRRALRPFCDPFPRGNYPVRQQSILARANHNQVQLERPSYISGNEMYWYWCS